MALPQYGIDAFNFEFWRGPAPAFNQDHGRVFSHPGVDGIGLQHTGIYGNQFEVVLESWHASQAAAAVAVAAMHAVQWSGALTLQYNGLNYTGLYGYWYHALEVSAEQIKTVPLLRRSGAGGTILSPGTRLITRWRLQPEYVEPE